MDRLDDEIETIAEKHSKTKLVIRQMLALSGAMKPHRAPNLHNMLEHFQHVEISDGEYRSVVFVIPVDIF